MRPKGPPYGTSLKRKFGLRKSGITGVTQGFEDCRTAFFSKYGKTLSVNMCRLLVPDREGRTEDKASDSGISLGPSCKEPGEKKKFGIAVIGTIKGGGVWGEQPAKKNSGGVR